MIHVRHQLQHIWNPFQAQVLLQRRSRPDMNFTGKNKNNECLEDLRRDGTSNYGVASTCFVRKGTHFSNATTTTWFQSPMISTGRLVCNKVSTGWGTTKFTFTWTLSNGHWDLFCQNRNAWFCVCERLCECKGRELQYSPLICLC